MSVKTFTIESIRTGLPLEVSIVKGQYVKNVYIKNKKVLSKMCGKPWTVLEKAEVFEIADTVRAYYEQP